MLRYYDGLTEREVAAALGVAVDTVRPQARDGLARLRELLPGQTLDDDPVSAVAGAPPPR